MLIVDMGIYFFILFILIKDIIINITSNIIIK